MKGGVGKTTLAVNIGYTVAEKFNKKVLLIDIDPQMNATQYTLNETQVSEILNFPRKSLYGILEPKENELPQVLATELPKKPEKFEGLYPITDKFSIIPSNLRLNDLKKSPTHPESLNNFIRDQLYGKYDIIVIDSPPTISGYTNLALFASDYYVVPMMADPFSLFGLPRLEIYISDIKSEYGLDISLLGIILNKVHPTHNLYKNIKAKILAEEPWKSKLFRSELKETTNITKALSEENQQGSQYIQDINDIEAATQIVEISKEFMQKGRF
jgi:chromosome partitioning protein